MTLGQTLLTLPPDLRGVEVRGHPGLGRSGGGLQLLEQPDLVDPLGVTDVADQTRQLVTHLPQLRSRQGGTASCRCAIPTVDFEHVFDANGGLRQNSEPSEGLDRARHVCHIRPVRPALPRASVTAPTMLERR